MAWSEGDLDTLRATLITVASGPQRVRYADGRETTFQTVDQVVAALKLVQEFVTDQAKVGTQRRRLTILRVGRCR